MTVSITITVDGADSVLEDADILEEFTWHNMRDSNHSRRVRQRIIEALLAPDMVARHGRADLVAKP